MTPTQQILSTLKRPSILIRAARFGLENYQRDRDLRRITRSFKTPSNSVAISQLVQSEEQLEDARQSGDNAYSAHRHISVLTALLAEMRLLPKNDQGLV
jgi:hypothetical protein